MSYNLSMTSLILFLLLTSALSSCPSSPAPSTTVSTNKSTFTSKTVEIGAVAWGSQTHSLYYMYKLHPDGALVRKELSDGTEKWKNWVGVLSSIKSLAVDQNEQRVYFASYTGDRIEVYILNQISK